MRKEVLFAIIIGIALGGIILFGINLANNSVNSETPKTIQPNPTSVPETQKQTQTLSIVSPQNHSVTSEKTVTLTGRSKPGATLAVVSESDDLLIEATPEGTFSAEINLISGENTVTVTELQADQTTKSIAITIIQTNNIPE